MALIELRNLKKRFGSLVVLDGVSLSIPERQSLVIIGASGTGKSVLLKHIVGLLKPDAGEVWYDGKRIDTLGERDLDPIRKQLGFLFQQGALFDSFTVEENVAFPIREHTDKSPAEIDRIVAEKLAMVGLPTAGKKMPAELSGGQRKRIALARAIALNPRVILYDEPTTGLDPIRSDVINELILKLQRELTITSITVTHDMHSAFKVADRIVMLREGKVIFDGTPDEMRQTDDRRVRSFVLGEAGPEDLEGLETNRPAATGVDAPSARAGAAAASDPPPAAGRAAATAAGPPPDAGPTDPMSRETAEPSSPPARKKARGGKAGGRRTV
jgi:phospholipid/cholesterol/gamma-HCH transport system ATP-binding protein